MDFIASATTATSASFQRSTPSAITKRRPSANVIALSAPATPSGVQASPSSSSTPPAPVSASAIARSRVRRSVIRPWSSPWIRYAGRKSGTAAESSLGHGQDPGRLEAHPAAGDAQADGAVAVGADELRDGAQRAQRRRRGMAVAVAADLDRRDPRRRPLEQRRQALVGAAVVGDLERVDPREVQRCGHVATRRRPAAAGRTRRPARARRRRGRSGRRRGASPPAGAGGHSTWSVERTEPEHLARAGAASARPPPVRASAPGSARWTAVGQPAPPSSTIRGRCAATTGSAIPS